MSVHSSCTQFPSDRFKVTLCPNAAYLPKVVSTSKNFTAFELLSSFPPPFASEEWRRVHSLCPLRTLCTYMDHTQAVRFCDHLFIVLIRLRVKRCPNGAYLPRVQNSKSPLSAGVRSHSTRGMATSLALFKGASLNDICYVYSWSSPHTFVWFYLSDVTTPSLAHSVLSTGSMIH